MTMSFKEKEKENRKERCDARGRTGLSKSDAKFDVVVVQYL